MIGFTLAYAVMRVCGGLPRKNPGAPFSTFNLCYFKKPKAKTIGLILSANVL